MRGFLQPQSMKLFMIRVDLLPAYDMPHLLFFQIMQRVKKTTKLIDKPQGP